MMEYVVGYCAGFFTCLWWVWWVHRITEEEATEDSEP